MFGFGRVLAVAGWGAGLGGGGGPIAVVSVTVRVLCPITVRLPCWSSEPPNSGVRQRLNRLVVTDVGWYGQRLDAQRPGHVRCARQCPFFDIREHNVKAIPCEPGR
jgi:hypothetical protein